MRYLITGASGFIGAATVAAALRAGHAVAVLARNPRQTGRLAPFADDITWISADLTTLQQDTVQREIAAFRPDVVIHAGWDGVAGADRNASWQVERNVPAALTLTLLAAQSGASHVIGLGSQAEYGPCSGRITEDQPLRPTTLYGAAKVAAATVTETAAALHGVKHTWLRVFSTYGPGADPAWVLPAVADAMARGQAPLLTRCQQRWEFLHVRDAAAAIIATADAGATGTYNLGSGNASPLRQVISALRDRIAPHIEPNFGALPYRPDQVMFLEADITRLRKATGWSPAVSLADGLDEIATMALIAAREPCHV